jgi:hypothetical protein
VKPRTSYSSKSRREAPSSSTSLASLVKPSIQSTPSSSWMSSKALLSIALSLKGAHKDELTIVVLFESIRWKGTGERGY